jgi:S1-C subfamily serine protease
VTPTPQEPPTGGPEEDGPDGSPDDTDVHPRGWVHPDDRLWRHPSELAGSPALAILTPSDGDHRSRIMLAVGAAAALAAVAWTVILLSPASDHPPLSLRSGATSDAPMTTLAGQVYALPSVADQASQSIVQLRAVTAKGVVTMVGVAVAEGGLVATTADGLDGLRSIDMVGADGHLLRASVVGVDRDSDLALVNVPDDLPVAPFADDVALSDGSADMTLSMSAPSTTTMTLRCTPGAVTAVGAAIVAGPANGMPSITSTASGIPEESGDPLLDPSGAVIGILYGDKSTTPTFLPAQLVLGVADDLRSSGRVSHGWLGVDGSDTLSTGGARVASVIAGSPASGVLRPGEVITGIGSLPVRSMADLRARLYVLSPDTPVVLSVLDGSVTRLVDVTLSASP